MSGTNPGRMHHHRRAADIARGAGIRPFIADDEGVFQVDMMFESGFHEQAGLRLATGAIVVFVMGADKDVIERESLAEQVVHAIQLAARYAVGGKTGLIRGDD